MLNGLIRASLHHRLVVLIAAFLALLAGLYVALNLPVDVFPDLTAPTVTVLTEAHGMAPEEVESLVTFPIETTLNGATSVRRVRSVSGIGISVVWTEFEWGTDIYRARQIVSEKLQLVTNALPEDASSPVMAPISSIMGEILLIAVTGPSERLMEMRTLADWTLRRRLLALPGVAQVVPIGGQVREYQILLDPERMRHHGVTLEQALAAAESAGHNAPGGFYVESGREYLIRGIGRARDLEALAKTPLPASASNLSATAAQAPPLVLLEHIAEVKIGAKPRRGTASVNGEEAVILSVQKQPGADTLDLTRRIDEMLQDLNLPPGLEIERHIFRQSDFIQVAVRNVLEALRDGALLVVIILFLFLLSWRTTLISVLAIPLSLIVTVFVFRLLDVGINTMTLGGMAIAIGALVDDAIIDVENVFRRLRENQAKPGAERETALQVIYQASSEVRYPILFATFIVIIVFIPLFALGGLEGRMLRPLGLAYIVSISASLLVALTVTPALCAYLLPLSRLVREGRESWVIQKLESAYRPGLKLAMRRPWLVMILSALLVVVSLAFVPFLGTTFLPEFNEGTLTVTMATVPGTALPQSDQLGRRAEEILLAQPEVLSTARRTGRAELDEHAQEVYGAEIDVRISPSIEDHGAFLERVRNQLALIPGTQIAIGQPISHRIDHMLSGTQAAVAVKLFGPDLLTLRALAQRIEAVMEGVPGVVDLQVEPQAHVPQVQIRFDRQALRRHGVSLKAAQQAVDAGLGGHTVGRLLEDQRSLDLVVRFSDQVRSNTASIGSLRVTGAGGVSVPLAQLADVRRDSGPNRISREDVQRKIVIQCNIAGRDLGSAVQDIRQAVEENVGLPQDYHVVYGGQFESERQARQVLMMLSAAAITFIYLILYLAFRSLRLAALMMANLPLALIGGVAAVYAGGGILSVASMVGFITLLGIATRNGILLVSRYESLVAEGSTVEEAIRRGSVERLSPILMTALTAGLALIPLALSGHEPGNEIQSPLAIVILGGLLSATFLNMVVLPALCLRFYPERRRQRQESQFISRFQCS
ncbi:MAG TPA: efflux RND transporter permease subunit [Acidobacteriota bacterium]|nr:efflux RND transporter permease subunit [Acidobacteriota bacterium]